MVTGDDGLYVSGTISELLLDEVKPGTVVTANSWESGMTFEATVTSVSDYPVSGNSWGEGNPNVSYYQYTAYMEDSSALKNGEFNGTSTADELLKIYAMYERAVLYDWALCKGKYSLTAYSDKLLPHVLDQFVEGF